MPKNGKPEDEGDEEKHGRRDDEAKDPKRFRPDPDATQRMIEEVFRDSMGQMHQEVQMAVARRVLGDVELFCPGCGGFCHNQVSRVRDCFMKRGYELVTELVELYDLYFRERRLGLDEPPELISRIYMRWAEAGMVYDMAEPQERISAEELFGPGFEDPGDPFADPDPGE